jgi:hypothetical protein
MNQLNLDLPYALGYRLAGEPLTNIAILFGRLRDDLIFIQESIEWRMQ